MTTRVKPSKPLAYINSSDLHDDYFNTILTLWHTEVEKLAGVKELTGGRAGI